VSQVTNQNEFNEGQVTLLVTASASAEGLTEPLQEAITEVIELQQSPGLDVTITLDAGQTSVFAQPGGCIAGRRLKRSDAQLPSSSRLLPSGARH
jgi:hypothetical protein